MKRKNILRISILPLTVLIALAVSNIQPQQGKEKNDKEQGQSGGKGKDNAHAGQNGSQGNAGNQGNNSGKSNKTQGQGNNGGQGKQNDNPGQGNSNKGQASNSQGRGNANDNQGQGKGKNNQGNDNRGNHGINNGQAGHGKMYRSNGNNVTMNGKRDTKIDWGFEDFANRRRPGGQKKVTICHHAGGVNSEYPVTISISENAVQAHLNHGDQLGNCSVNYGDRWSSYYLDSRQNVYNSYEQAWETMSFGEALLNYAVQRLLGVRTDFDRNRINYTSQEIQRREALIYELQNNVDVLENQLGYTRQRLDSDVNIIIRL